LSQLEFDISKFAHTLETGSAGELVVEPQELETAQKVWDYGVKAGFIQDDGGTVSFRYLVYQEYFAAYYLRLQPLTKNLLHIAADWYWHYVWDILQELEKDLINQLLSFLQAEEKTSLDALYILGQLRNAEAVESLIKIVENEAGATLEMRKYGAMALGHIGDEKSVEFLIQALKTETNPDLRCWMVEGLGSTDDLRAIPLLESIAENDNSKTSWKKPLKKAAANAIRSIKSRQPE